MVEQTASLAAWQVLADQYANRILELSGENADLRSRLAAADAERNEQERKAKTFRKTTDDTLAALMTAEASLARVTQLAESWRSVGADESTRWIGQHLLDVIAGKPQPPGAVLDSAAPVGARLVPDDTCRCRYVEGRPVYLCEYHHD